MSFRYPVGQWKATPEETQSVLDVIKSGQLSPGPKVAQFEEAFAKKHQCPYGIMTNSGTDALRIALLALKERYGWKDGDVVYTSAMTFVATVNAILQAGLKPKLADVCMYDGNMNMDNLEWRLETSPDTSRVKAVIPVHLFGNPCDMKRLREIAKRFNLVVLEDSCEAIGPEVGFWGEGACFSFYMAHLMTTGVGGMITTRDKDLAQLARSFMNHGRDSDKTGLDRFHFNRIGYSSRPTELEAALGLCQLNRLDKTLRRRTDNAFVLMEALSSLPIKLLTPESIVNSAWMMFPLRCNFQSERDELVNHLEFNGIETRPIFSIHDQPCYRDMWQGDFFSVADDWKRKGFYIGCSPDWTADHLVEIIHVFQLFDFSQYDDRP